METTYEYASLFYDFTSCDDDTLQRNKEHLKEQLAHFEAQQRKYELLAKQAQMFQQALDYEEVKRHEAAKLMN